MESSVKTIAVKENYSCDFRTLLPVGLLGGVMLFAGGTVGGFKSGDEGDCAVYLAYSSLCNFIIFTCTPLAEIPMPSRYTASTSDGGSSAKSASETKPSFPINFNSQSLTSTSSNPLSRRCVASQLTEGIGALCKATGGSLSVLLTGVGKLGATKAAVRILGGLMGNVPFSGGDDAGTRGTTAITNDIESMAAWQDKEKVCV